MEVGMVVMRPSFGDMFWRALGGALFALGFAFFRNVASWFLGGVAASGIDISEMPYGQQRPPAARPSLFGSPTPTTSQTQSTTSTAGIDLSEFR